MKIKRHIVGLFVILLLCSLQYLQLEYAVEGQITGDDWPTFGHDLMNTRVSASSAPKLPNLIWEFDGRFGGGEGIAVSEGRVFFGLGSNPIDFLVMTEFYCLNETDGAILWTAQVNGTITNSPAVYGNVVVVGTATGHVYNLNADTGVTNWEIELSERIYLSSPVISNGRIIVGGWAYGDYGSHVFCLNLQSGAILWSFQVNQAVYSTAAIVGGHIFIGGTGYEGKVYCIDEVTGSLVWEYAIGDHIQTSPSVIDGRVFIASNDNRIYCLNAVNGLQIWNYTFTSWTRSSPAVSEGKVFIASEDGNVYCLEAATGSKIWIYKAVNQIVSSPSVADGMVFISSSNLESGIQAINKTDGTLVWNFTALAQGSSPVVANGKIFESFLGKIYCIGSPYSLEIAPNFNDNNGNPLETEPSEWSVLFPNGTIVKALAASVKYPLASNGKYSIVSVIWQGQEVIPDNKPTISVTSNYTWAPNINCKLPTQLTLELGTSTLLMGLTVDINGRITDNENVGITGAQILLSYSTTSAEPWTPITAVSTATGGSYTALWMPAATGNFFIKAKYEGNETFPSAETTLNLAIIPHESKEVFSISSNSTVSALAFSSASNTLDFTVSGQSGTIGFVKAQIAKNLIGNVADLKVYLDGDNLQYHLTQTSDSLVLKFNYFHSTHNVLIDLGNLPSSSLTPSPAPTAMPTSTPLSSPTSMPTLTPTSTVPEFPYLLVIPLLLLALAVALAFKIKKPDFIWNQ